VAGLVVIMAAAIIGVVAWQSVSRQAHEESEALALSIEEAGQADSDLRKALIDRLNPAIKEAEALRQEAADLFGESDTVVTGLAEAIEVGDALKMMVAGNPTAAPSTRADAEVAMREDEDQLALVDPVVSSLAAASTTVQARLDAHRLGEAVKEMNAATNALSEVIAEAQSLKTAIDEDILTLTAPATIGAVPAVPPTEGATPSPSPTKSKPKASPKASASKGSKPDDDAASDSESAASPSAPAATALDTERLDSLRDQSEKLNTAIAEATEVLNRPVKEDNIEAVQSAATDRTDARNSLGVTVRTAQSKFPELSSAVD
jgi:hypothetical protein